MYRVMQLCNFSYHFLLFVNFFGTTCMKYTSIYPLKSMPFLFSFMQQQWGDNTMEMLRQPAKRSYPLPRIGLMHIILMAIVIIVMVTMVILVVMMVMMLVMMREMMIVQQPAPRSCQRPTWVDASSNSCCLYPPAAAAAQNMMAG